MRQWKRSLVSMFYQVSPKEIVFLIHRKLHKDGIDSWGNGGVCFIHVPKTAGTSLGDALQVKDPGHLSYRELCRRSWDRPAVKEAPILIVYRDPIERLVSTIKYAYINKKEKGFSSIQSLYKEVRPGVLEPRHKALYYKRHFFTRPFSDFLTGSDSRDVWIVNFNLLQDGFESFCSANGLGRIIIPKLNASRSEVSVSISKEFSDDFKRLYAADFEVGALIKGRASIKVCDLGIHFGGVS